MTALALGTLLLGLTAALLLRRAPAAARRFDGTVPGTPLREALTSRTFAWLYAMCGLGAFGMFIPFAHLSAAARDLGVPDARAVGLVGLIGIGSLSGRFAIGALADRVGRPRTLVLSWASLGASFVLWALADGYLALAAFALWMGTSYGGIVSLMPALCMDRFGARAVSSIIGTLYSAAALGNLAGPWLAGRIFDATGSYGIVTWGCLALTALATWCTWQALRR
jgi:predicted MFS family arabinose efflux permease